MSLQGDLIKLAHDNPELQPKLLPVLKEALTVAEAIKPWFKDKFLEYKR